MDDAVVFTKHIIDTYNPDAVVPFVGIDGFYHFTYLTINTVNNKFYLGKHTTKDLNDGYIGSGTAFLNAIKKHGQSNFQHYRLQFLNTAQDAYVAEALMITEDVLKKYKDELKVCYNLKTGGGGGVLSEESKEKHRQAMKESHARPEYKEKLRQAMKENRARPEVKEKISKTTKEAMNRPEVKEKMIKAIKESRARPEVKEKRSKAMKESLARPEVKEKISKALKEIYARPEHKEKMSKALKEAMNRPEVKVKLSESMKKSRARPEVKEKHRQATKEAMNRPEVKAKIKEILARPEYKEKISKALKESKAKKEMIYQSKGEKKSVHTNDVLSHLKAGWTFIQSHIIIYNKKLNLQKTIMFKNNKDKCALYKRLIGYLENGYEIGKRPIRIEEEVSCSGVRGGGGEKREG
jgi:hypothetical protein